MMIQRKEYLDKLLGWKEEKVIKVITGEQWGYPGTGSVFEF